MATTHRQQWVAFDPNLQSLEDYLKQWKPTVAFEAGIHWICVSNLKADTKMDSVDTQGLMAAWERHCVANLHKVYSPDVLELAKCHNVISGKWLLFVPTSLVDGLWQVIATAVMSGKLGHDAKVSTLHELVKLECSIEKTGKLHKAFDLAHDMPNAGTPMQPVTDDLKGKGKQAQATHVICVYHPDFNDIEGAFVLREKLRELGFTKKAGFKPVAYSFCGIYFNNRWGIPPIIFYD